MKLVIFSALLLFVGLAASKPCKPSHAEGLVDEDFFSCDFCYNIYTSENDVVNIFAWYDKNPDVDDHGHIFFVEKDLASGEDKGLFLRNRTKITKLLSTGRDIGVSTNDDTKIYFAAADGIYIYNSNENKADKYGTVTDDLINIAVDNTNDVIYVLTKNKELFKVTDNGKKQEKVSDVSNAEQIVMGYKNNLFYYTPEKEVYILNEGGVKKVEGLPKNPNKVSLLNPLAVAESSVTALVDDKAFEVHNNGTIENTSFKFELKPTAITMRDFTIHYFAYNKKIYACRTNLRCNANECMFVYSN